MKKIISVICLLILLVNITQTSMAATKDTKAPTITKTSPVNQATDIMKETEIVLRFSELVKKGKRIDQISIKSSVGKTVAFTYEIKDNLLIITPKAKLAYNTNYTVTIPSGAVKDASGNTLKKEKSFDFITEEDPKTAPATTAEGITYDVGLEVTLQGEFTTIMQQYFVQYLEMLGIKAKITKVKMVK